MDVPMEHLQCVSRPSPAASGQDRSPLRLMERISRAKHRTRKARSSGTVGGEGGNLLAYPAAVMNRRRAMLAAIFASIALAFAGLVGLAGHYTTARNDDDDE